MKDGHVYFIEAVGLGLIKIGWAVNPRERRDGLQTGSPVELALLGSYPGSLLDEADAHRRFAGSRASGEWFRESDSLRSFVREHASIDEYQSERSGIIQVSMASEDLKALDGYAAEFAELGAVPNRSATIRRIFREWWAENRPGD